MRTGRKLDPFLVTSDLRYLSQATRSRVDRLGALCYRNGIKVVVDETVRGPGEQGKLWCASRTPEEISTVRESLTKVAPRLALFLREEWAGNFRPLCQELPGNSWHQWSTAVDVYPLLGGKKLVGTSLNVRVAELAAEAGLLSGVEGLAGAPLKPHHFQLSRYRYPIFDRDGAGNWGEIDAWIAEVYDV